MKPQRTFSANAGETSKDTRGPDAIEKDLDNINKMFNPDATHSDGTTGGIGKVNLNFNLLDPGGDTTESMAEQIGSKAIAELKDPSNSSLSALTVWKQIKAMVLLFVSHATNYSNPHSVTNSQVGLGSVTNDKQATKTEFDSHTSNVTNPHSVTKTQIGLGNADNTSDASKPISTAQALVNAAKVDKVTGKSLIADTEIARLLTMASNAEQNVQSDWNITDTASDAYIKNKPSLGTSSSKDTGTTSGTIPILDANGKLNIAVIPATAITNTLACATIAVRDAWTDAAEGDVAIVATPPSTYIKSSTGWIQMATPTDNVLSVAGRTGAIVLTAADVSGALTVADILNALTSEETTKALSAAQGKVLKGLCDTLATSLSNFMTTYNGFASNTNTALNGKVDSSTIKAVRYNSGSFEYSTDGTTWTNLTGAKGDTGKGYNPRGTWVSGGSYTNNNFTIDVVVYSGSSYYAKATHAGISTNPAADTTNWGPLATSGATSTGAEILLSGYAIGSAGSAIASTDTVNAGLGKLEKRVADGETNFASNVISAVLTGLSTATNSVIAATDSIVSALGKLQSQINARSTKSTTVSATLAAASWTGTSAPYSYTLAVTGVTTTSNQELIPATAITSAQLAALQKANIQDYSQAANSITVRSWGAKPTIDVPIRVIVRGDA